MRSAVRQDGTHPRPLLIREGAVILDGPAGFAFDDADRGWGERWYERSDVFDRTIELPFAPESPASGIADAAPHRVVWYRIELPSVDAPERLLLHFGAVDRIADVWIDGIHVGRHEGGQTAFSFDITDARRTGGGDSVIVVRAEDDPHDPAVPRGKQDWHPHPHSIWYHRITGIWRSVWLEPVPAVRIESIAWSVDIPAARLTGEVTLSHATAATVEVKASLDGEPLGRAAADGEGMLLTVDVPLPVMRNGQALDEVLWTPDHPRLVDLEVHLSVDGHETDRVASYTGIRTVGVGDRRMMLNDRPLFLRSVLEQGYWPDSHYTPPSAEAIRAEVELILRLGFNSVRIHQKVEDARFLYWCDRLGLTVWCESASAYAFTPDAIARQTADWVRIVRAYRSYPSIIAWVPFNESWGISHVRTDPRQQAYARGMSDLTRALDGTRPVISNDGWEHTHSDIVSLHDYTPAGETMRLRYQTPIDLTGRGPHGRPMLVTEHDETLPIMVSEFGGIQYDKQPPDDGEGWGYSVEESAEGFERRLRALVTALYASPGLAGFCYTQITDTRQERNGLCDERRQPKVDETVLREIFTGE